MILISNTYSNEINVSSKKLEVDKTNNVSTFYGDVYVLEKDIEIWADKLTIKFSFDNNKVEELLAENNVRIIREGITATGQKGVYNPSLNEVKMFRNVQVVENNNIVNCDELILDIKNSISIMRGNNNKRVEAQIISDK